MIVEPITSIINIKTQYAGTDELCTEFYNCPRCEFERVPRLQDNDFARAEMAEEAVTAQFCPGCGRPIVWRDNS